MAGEMSQSEVTRESYPLHFAIADEFNGDVRAFDQYQGPYVLCDAGKFWISCDDDGFLMTVYNDRTDKSSEPFPPYKDETITCQCAVDAAKETLANVYSRHEHRDS